MRGPAIATLWQLWTRHRWGLVASTIYFFAVSALCHAMPESPAFRPAEFAMAIPMLVGLLLFTAIFAYAFDADVASKDSIFPARIFTLPITSRALVGWPMVYGTVAIALAWLAVAGFVLRPAGMDVPLWWPAVLLAAALAWVQALAWQPFGLPGLRVVAAVLPIGVLVAVPSLGSMYNLPEATILLLLAATIPPAYVVAVAGVSRARRGDQPDWQWAVAAARTVAGWFSSRGRPFASAGRAQVWFEWRLGGLALPMIVGLAIPVLAALVATSRHNPRLPASSPLRSPIVLLLLPPLLMSSAGSAFGRSSGSRDGLRLPAFSATRPMTSTAIVLAKLKAAAISTVLACAIALTATALLFLLTGSFVELADQWGPHARGFSTLENGAILILAVLLWVAGTWKLAVENMFLGLTGRYWVHTAGVIVVGSGLVALIPLACWINMHPEYHDSLLRAVPWLVGSAAVLKLILAGWSLRALRRRRLLGGPAMARLLGLWLAGAVTAMALLCWLLPPHLAPGYLTASCVVIALPLVRISLAPLALAWNRHR